MFIFRDVKVYNFRICVSTVLHKLPNKVPNIHIDFENINTSFSGPRKIGGIDSRNPCKEVLDHLSEIESEPFQ